MAGSSGLCLLANYFRPETIRSAGPIRDATLPELIEQDTKNQQPAANVVHNLTDEKRGLLLDKARKFVNKTVKRRRRDDIYFRKMLQRDEIFLILRPYLSNEFIHALTSGRVAIFSPPASEMSGIAWLFSREIDRLEKEWGLSLEEIRKRGRLS